MSPALRAAHRRIDAYLDLNLAVRGEVVGDIHELYACVLLLGQAAAVEQLVLPEFQHAFGEDLRRLAPAVREVLETKPPLVLTPVCVCPKATELQFIRVENGVATLDVPAFGLPNFIPACFVAALADHAHGIRLSGHHHVSLSHQCAGGHDQWSTLRHQASQFARTMQ